MKGEHVWQRGACMVKGGIHGERGMHGERGAYVVCTPFYEIRPVNAQAVRILLECILVIKQFSFMLLTGHSHYTVRTQI